MNERQSGDTADDHLTARINSLKHHMARNAGMLFMEFAERHGIDPDEDDMTPEQEAEWADIRAGLEDFYEVRIQTIKHEQ